MTAPGYRLVPAELLDRFPEINPSNYDHDDACALNTWGCEVVTASVPQPEPQMSADSTVGSACRPEPVEQGAAPAASSAAPEPPADLVEKANRFRVHSFRYRTPAEMMAAFAQEHAAIENKRIRDDALAALMDAEHDLCEARLDLAAEKARADKAEKALGGLLDCLDDGEKHLVYVADCRDNSGKLYQSAALDRWIKLARSIRTRKGGGDAASE